MVRQLIRLVVLAAISATGTFLFVYWRRRCRWAATWGTVPPNHWEQIAAQIKCGKGTPLDTADVMASVQEWLESING